MFLNVFVIVVFRTIMGAGGWCNSNRITPAAFGRLLVDVVIVVVVIVVVVVVVVVVIVAPSFYS